MLLSIPINPENATNMSMPNVVLVFISKRFLIKKLQHNSVNSKTQLDNLHLPVFDILSCRFTETYHLHVHVTFSY